MAITNKEQGVWETDEVYNKIMEGDIWSYDGAFDLYCVGVGNETKMGLNTPQEYYSSPIQLPGNWASYSAGYKNAAGVKSDGTLWTWGMNEYGFIGDNSSGDPDYSSPVQVPGTTWDRVCVHVVRGCFATKTDGTLWSWGKNEYGQLGHNNKTNYSSPKQVGSDTSWQGESGKLSTGQRSVAAIKTDGSLWRWGQNEQGQLGQNNKTDYSSPKQVPGTYVYCAAGWYNALQVRAPGTVWFTGWGERYSNGIGSQQGYSSPRQVPGLAEDGNGDGPFGTAVKCKMMETGTGYVINEDGDLFSWGYNSNGQTGKKNPGSASILYSPCQIPGTWEHIETARTAAYGQKTNGTLWAWGQNFQGYLGQNDRESRSSPIQIGSGTDWDLSRTNSYFAGAMGLIEKK
tara:strand:+ start:2521 stop:3720 length:1200 start_codon:yes stop_codon:yes gene_type:complete